MYQNAEKKIQENIHGTLLSTIFSGVAGRAEIFLSVPGSWLSRLSIKTFALTVSVKG